MCVLETFSERGWKRLGKRHSRSLSGGFSPRRRCIFHFFALAQKSHQKGAQNHPQWVPGPQNSARQACIKWLLAMPARVSWVSTFFLEKLENARPSPNTSRHCPNASSVHVENIIWASLGASWDKVKMSSLYVLLPSCYFLAVFGVFNHQSTQGCPQEVQGGQQTSKRWPKSQTCV